MTTDNLISVIKRHKLYAGENDNNSVVGLVQLFRNSMSLELISADAQDRQTGRTSQATIAFKLSFDHHSPSVAQEIANEIALLYINENLRIRKTKAKDTTEFLAKEAELLSKDLASLEAELARFKEQHASSLPELMTFNLGLTKALNDDISGLAWRRQILDERIVFLESQLALISSKARTAKSQTAIDPAYRLELLRAKLANLSASYGAAHPSIINLKREIRSVAQDVSFDKALAGKSDAGEVELLVSSLRQRLAEALEKSGGGNDKMLVLARHLSKAEARLEELASPMAGRADDPAFIQLRSQLKSAELERQSLIQQIGPLEARRTALEGSIRDSPRVEQDYRKMLREHENMTSEYRAIKVKLMQAQLAHSVETERKGERFSLIEPPRLPETPVRPNRKSIATIGFVIAVLTGAFVILVIDYFDGRVHGTSQLARVIGETPMVVIPRILTPIDRIRIWSGRVGIAAMALGTIGGALFAVHTYYLPLDVIVLKLEHKVKLLQLAIGA